MCHIGRTEPRFARGGGGGGLPAYAWPGGGHPVGRVLIPSVSRPPCTAEEKRGGAGRNPPPPPPP